MSEDRVLVRLTPTIEQVLYYRVYTPPSLLGPHGDLKQEIKMKGPKDYIPFNNN